MLRSVEELVLLLIDEKRGDLVPTPDWTLACTLAGAILMDLSLEGRIDTDPERLVVLDGTPIGDSLLDPVLAEITGSTETHAARFWVERIAARGDEIRDRALTHLTEQAILDVQEEGFLSILPSTAHARRYPSQKQEMREDVRLRVMRVLFNHDVPDPKDVVIISLAAACGAFERLLSPSELQEVSERLALVSRMDLIGRAVLEAIQTAELPPAATTNQIPLGKPLPTLSVLFSKTYILEQYRELGPIFRVKKNRLTKLIEILLITKPLARRGKTEYDELIVMAGPEANRFFAKNDNAYFRTREFWMRFEEQFDHRASRSMGSTSGEDHFRMRRAKRPGYSRSAAEAQIPAIVDVTRQEIACWPADTAVISTTMCKRLVFNLMCRTMAGISAPEYFEDFVLLGETAFRAMFGLYPSRRKRRRLRDARKRVDELTQKIIRLHRPQYRGSRPPDLVDHLLSLHQADPQFLPETDLGMNVLEPILAPVDTMSHALSFMLYELLSRPQLLKQAQAEADALFAQGMPTAQGIQQLDVIRRAYMETLRLYSIVAHTVRTVSNTFEFAGCTVPAGTQVILEFSLPHRMPEYFPDPNAFDIDRFAPPRDEHQQPNAYMPYGIGTHRCLGSHLADFLSITTMATILHEADLRTDPSGYVLTSRKIARTPMAHPNKTFRFRVLRRRFPTAHRME